MVANGNVAAALARLQDRADGIQQLPAMSADEIRQKLEEKALFPAATDADTVPASEGMEGLQGALQISRGHVTGAFDKLKVGSASGQSGWSAKLLQVLAADNDKEQHVDGFITAMVVFFNLLLRGDVRGADMLTVSRVAMLPKKDSGVRPIAIGDALLAAC